MFVVQLALFVVPLAIMFVYSFWTTKNFQIVTEWTLVNYRTFFDSWTYPKVLLRTLVSAVVITVLTIAMAYPLAVRDRALREALAEGAARRGDPVVLDQRPVARLCLDGAARRRRHHQQGPAHARPDRRAAAVPALQPVRSRPRDDLLLAAVRGHHDLRIAREDGLVIGRCRPPTSAPHRCARSVTSRCRRPGPA
jgi:hypothetical protein